jgi:uncharacterized SAM-binding protein YcdF (DUF218 family)
MRTAARRTLIAMALALVAALTFGVVDGGRYLQHEDPLEHADAIFVLAGARLERVLESVDLHRSGYADVIALSPGREEAAEQILRARGISFPREADTIRGVVVAMGVPASAVLVGSGSVDNTADEGLMLRRLAAGHRWRTVIVVTSKYHTRRTGFAMRRALDGSGVRVIVRASRYDMADPAHWWRARGDVRFVAEEWQKLIAYRLGLAD